MVRTACGSGRVVGSRVNRNEPLLTCGDRHPSATADRSDFIFKERRRSTSNCSWRVKSSSNDLGRKYQL